MAQRVLRPLDLVGLLDEMFDLYRKNFLLFAGIAGVVYLPVYLIVCSLAGIYATPIAAVMILPLSLTATAAGTWAVSQTYIGKPTTILGSYQAIIRRMLPFAGTMIVASLIIWAGFLLLVIPGIIFSFWYAFISEVFVIEGKASSEARRRSRQLAAGQWGRIFLLTLIAGLLAAIVSGILTWPVQMLFLARHEQPTGALYGLASGLAYTLATPIQIIALVLLYYDVRVRKEGFDIEMLAQSMGESVAQPGANP
ncbi:MAG TPA: hypothetical protein VMX94_10590 [Armatimonadota bacterium]|nr:hypothetical protein [Armatimonadota bacterium]